MSRREALQKAHREIAARDRRRLIAVAATGVLALVLFVALEFTREDPKAAEVQDEPIGAGSLALAPVDHALLDGVRDATLAEQVAVEPEPAAHLATIARTLTPSILQRLGEPAFPFAAAEARAAELRGELFRLRGTVVEASDRDRGAGAERWSVLRTDGGETAVFAGVLPPERALGAGDWAVADGYFLKRHSLQVGGERLTLPLFFGARLRPSVPAEPPARRPDLARLAAVRDTEMFEEAEPDMAATWHLANVARELRSVPAELDAVFAEVPWLSAPLLAQFNESPEAFRGAALRVGGSVFHGSRRLVGENPLREEYLSEGWLRNSNLGDFPILVRTPGRFDWEKALGAWEFRGWFQQMWAYEDGSGNWRRVPLFVFADARPIEVRAPPFAGQIVWVVIGMVALLVGTLAVLVFRDRARARQAESQLLERRRKRRGT